MGVKQILLSGGKKVRAQISYVAVALLLLSTVSALFHTTPALAACTPPAVPGVSGTPQGDPSKCYTPGNNTPVGDNSDTGTGTANGQAGGNAGASDSTNEGTTCAIQKIGWILCPIIETSGKVSDQAFKFLAKTFLETQPELVSNTEGKGTKYAWELARNLANIMFIIAFLIIIYSQVTGAGITNYGIKKMLPRIIVAAIAVNASYYICQIIVDLSNIMGYEIQKFMVDAAAQITSNTAMPIASGDSFEQGGGVLSNIAIAVLALGAIVYFLLPVLGAVISLVLITCLSIIIILLLRKAFIVLLIVAAPVAFVAYLLPNTEKYFQKWLSMFWKLLMVFPVVGMLLGAGQLASAVILSAGANSNTYADASKKCINLPTAPKDGKASQTPTSSEPADCVPGAVPFSLGLTAAGIAVIPLLAVWSVLKGALSAAGAIGGKIGATVSNMDKGRKANLAKQRQELGEERSNKRALAAMENRWSPSNIATAGQIRRRAFRDARRNSVKQQLGRATEDAVFDKAFENGELTSYGRKMAGEGLLRDASDAAKARVTRSLQGVEQKNEQEESNALQYQFRNADSQTIQDELDKAVKAGDAVMIRAFTEALSKRGSNGADRIADVVKANHTSKDLQNVINNYTDLKSKRADVDAWASKGGTLESNQTSEVYGKLSDAQLAGQTEASFGRAEAAGVLDERVKFIASDGSVIEVSRGASLSNVKEMSGKNKETAARH